MRLSKTLKKAMILFLMNWRTVLVSNARAKAVQAQVFDDVAQFNNHHKI